MRPIGVLPQPGEGVTVRVKTSANEKYNIKKAKRRPTHVSKKLIGARSTVSRRCSNMEREARSPARQNRATRQEIEAMAAMFIRPEVQMKMLVTSCRLSGINKQISCFSVCLP